MSDWERSMVLGSEQRTHGMRRDKVKRAEFSAKSYYIRC